MDGFQPKLVVTLAIGWTLCFFCIWKGIKSTGKSSYVTALFPYVMLVILFVRGVTLPGAGKGISFYLKPDFSKISNIQVISEYDSQVIISGKFEFSYYLGGKIDRFGSMLEPKYFSHTLLLLGP